MTQFLQPHSAPRHSPSLPSHHLAYHFLKVCWHSASSVNGYFVEVRNMKVCPQIPVSLLVMVSDKVRWGEEVVVKEPPRRAHARGRSISPTTAVSAGVSAKREKQGYFRVECSAVAVGSTVLHVCVDVLWEMRSCWFFLSRLVQLNTLASTLFYRVSAGMREDLQSSIRHTSSDHFSELYLLSL